LKRNILAAANPNVAFSASDDNERATLNITLFTFSCPL
jgi:hypothetical protein